MTTSQVFALILLLGLPVTFSACKDDDDNPKPVNQDTELITTVRYSLTAPNGFVRSVQYRDLDGDGGAAPVITYSGVGNTKLLLVAGEAYTGELLLLDESKSPVDTISNEVLAEANEHLFVYTAAPASLLTITRTDRDTNVPPLELGLTTRLTAGPTAGSGTLNIVLKHQPGSKNGTAGPGDTDVDVTFPVEVQ